MAPCVCRRSGPAWMHSCIPGRLLLLLSVAALCLLCVPASVLARRTAVKACLFKDGSTAANPCKADLYVGEFMTFECGTQDVQEPPVEGDVSYCTTPLGDTSKCTEVATLDREVGTVVESGGVVNLRLSRKYSPKFKDIISFNIRCAKAGEGGGKVFVSATLWPFTRPMISVPKKSCDVETDKDTSSQDTCNFFIYGKDVKHGFNCDLGDESKTEFEPSGANTPEGSVCTSSLNTSNKCDTPVTWNEIAPGAVITGAEKSMGIVSSAMTVKRALVYIGCKAGGATLFGRGMLFSGDFTQHPVENVKMIKHVCTPGKGGSVGAPCEVSLGAGEAAVMVCTPFLFVPKNFKLMPEDTNSTTGSFCVDRPTAFDSACQQKKKWAEDAKAVVSMDGTMDFFVIGLPKSNAAQLKTETVAYGYCSESPTIGLAWKVTLTPGGGGGGGWSAAAPLTGRIGVAVGLLTLLASSFVAAVIM